MSAPRSKTRSGAVEASDERKKTRGEANSSEGGSRTDQAVRPDNRSAYHLQTSTYAFTDMEPGVRWAY